MSQQKGVGSRHQKGNVMQKNLLENNRVKLIGEMASDFSFSHEVYGEKFYRADIAAERLSGVADVVPVLVSDWLVDLSKIRKGCYVWLAGEFRSHNKCEDGRLRLILSVFSRDIAVHQGDKESRLKDQNDVFLDGYICKEPVYRKTPSGREIADILVAVNRPYGKSDYIPCLCWGRNARFMTTCEVGTHIKLEGRIQSRIYQKRVSDTLHEKRVAYEVSVSKIRVVEESELCQ